MEAVEVAGTCALQVVAGVDCIGNGDAYSKKLSKDFDAMLEQNMAKGNYQGEYVTGSIVTISDEDEEWFAKADAFLKIKKFKLLGTWPGAHGNYKMYLYGGPTFKRVRGK